MGGSHCKGRAADSILGKKKSEMKEGGETIMSCTVAADYNESLMCVSVCVWHLVAIIKTFRLRRFRIQARVDVIKRSLCKFVWRFRLCRRNGLNALKYERGKQTTNVCRRGNFLCIVLVTNMSA